MTRSNWERQNYMASRAGEGDLEDNLPHGCVQYYVAGWCNKMFGILHCINKKYFHDILNTVVVTAFASLIYVMGYITLSQFSACFSSCKICMKASTMYDNCVTDSEQHPAAGFVNL